MRALRIKGLMKKYRGFTLGPLSLDLDPGTVVGYVGPNASGKTTTFRCLTQLTRPDAGSAEIFGQENRPDSPDWKFDVGFVGDNHAFFEKCTGEANLRFRSRFYPTWSDALAKDLARRFECPLDKKAKDMSTGNRVKLSLISAFAHSPRLLLLDEPTAGLDPVVRQEVLDVLFEILEDGERSILYATHILTDIARLADELVFLVDGKLLQRSSKDDLLDKWRRITFRLSGNAESIAGAVAAKQDGEDHQVISIDAEETMKDLRTRQAGAIQATRMTVEEIAVEILKGGRNVAHN